MAKILPIRFIILSTINQYNKINCRSQTNLISQTVSIFLFVEETYMVYTFKLLNSFGFFLTLKIQAVTKPKPRLNERLSWQKTLLLKYLSLNASHLRKMTTPKIATPQVEHLFYLPKKCWVTVYKIGSW